MINYLISILVSLGFWGKATQETEEKTVKSSWLRTLVYAVLTIIVSVLFYKTYQIQHSNWTILAMQAKGAYNEQGKSLDSLSIMVRKFVTAHDTTWMKIHNEDYYWSGIDFKYICGNDTNTVYKLNRSLGEFFPLGVLDPDKVGKLPNISTPGYSSIDKLRKDLTNPGLMQDLLLKYSSEQELEAWEKHVLHRYEDSLYSELGAAFKVFFLISKPESLIPFMIRSKEEKTHAYNYPFIKNFETIDSNTISKTRLTFSYMNGERMTYDETMNYLKEFGFLNGDMYEITSFATIEDIKAMPDSLRWTQGYFVNSAEYSTDFFSAFDLSQSSQSIMINSNMPVGMLQIRFDIPFELIGCDIQPDYLTITDIGFKDPEKTKRIQERGISLHVKYPTMENKQLIRSLILTTLLTALLSLFLSNLYYCLRKAILSTQEKKNIVISKKFQYLINTLIVAILMCLLYYSYILVWNEKIIVNERDVVYYLTYSIIAFVVLTLLIIFAYKKLK